MIPRALQPVLALITLSVLSGCALPRMIDSEVQSFAGATPLTEPAEFRFERLPSQSQQQDLQDAIERIAQEALERAGLSRKDTTGRYLVQVSLGVEQIRNPYFRPPRPRLVRGSDGRLHEEWPLHADIDVPWFRHRAHLTLRDSHNSQVAFETTAVFDGPWRDSLNLLPPMLEAALKDYPSPGNKRVVVELPAPGNAHKQETP